MKYVVTLLVGVGLGFLVAHQVSKTEQGKAFFDKMDATTKDLSDAVVSGYRQREAELRSRARRS